MKSPTTQEERASVSPTESAEYPVVSCPSLEVVIKATDMRLVGRIQAIFSASAVRENGSLPLEKPARLICEVTHKRCEITLEQGIRGESLERQVFYPENSDHLMRNLEWSISNKLARSLTNYHLFHAGSIARNGRGVLIPGTSGAGKSSTVAALALSGFDYCSDEVAVLGRDGRLRPFPKTISLKAGGWRHVAADFPAASQQQLVCWLPRESLYYLRPPQVPDEEFALSGYPVHFILLPTFSKSRKTWLQPAPKSLALATLIEQSLDLAIRRSEGFDLIVDLVQHAECYVLNINSLADVPEVVDELVR